MRNVIRDFHKNQQSYYQLTHRIPIQPKLGLSDHLNLLIILSSISLVNQMCILRERLKIKMIILSYHNLELADNCCCSSIIPTAYLVSNTYCCMRFLLIGKYKNFFTNILIYVSNFEVEFHNATGKKVSIKIIRFKKKTGHSIKNVKQK